MKHSSLVCGQCGVYSQQGDHALDDLNQKKNSGLDWSRRVSFGLSPKSNKRMQFFINKNILF